MANAIAAATTPGQGAGQTDPGFAFAARLVQKAERAGFATTLIAERWLGPDLESWILATALATCTNRIEIMAAVHPGILAPQVVAKMGASLDRISGGRFAVNIVNGWWPQEMNLFGNGAWLEDPDARSRRMTEFIDVLRALWTEAAPDIAGEWFRADAPLPLRPVRTPHPPVYAASRTPRGKDTIARTCHAWFAEYEPELAHYPRNLEKIRTDILDMRERAARHGRTLRIGLSGHMICAPTQGAAQAAADDLLAYGQRDRIAQVAAKALGAGLVGTKEVLAERIRAYEAIGVDLIMLRWHEMEAGLDAFTSEVMPLLG